MTEESGNALALLEVAAQEGDEGTFAQAVHQIDWAPRSTEEFAQAVRLALAAGAPLLARKLADEGAKSHPEHAELQKMARILAPPRVVETGLPADPSVTQNQTWLRTHRDDYKGQWVALRNGVLVASAATAAELKARIGPFAGLFVTRVF